MSDRSRLRVAFSRPLILVGTGLLIWASLWVGQPSRTVELVEGDTADTSYAAPFRVEVENEKATEDARQAAAADVPPVFVTDPEVETVVTAEIRAVFDDARAGTAPVEDVATLEEQVAASSVGLESEAETTTTTEAPAEAPEVSGEEGEEAPPEETTTTTIPRNADVAGVLYIDVDLSGDFADEIDVTLPSVRVEVTDSQGDTRAAVTSRAGSYAVRDLAAGPGTVVVDPATVPERLTTDLALLTSRVELVANDTVELPPLGFTALIRDAEGQRIALEAAHGNLSVSTIDLLVEFASGDVIRAAAGESQWLQFLEQESVIRATDELRVEGGILPEELEAVKTEVRNLPQLSQVPADSFDTITRASVAEAEIASVFLQANTREDESATIAAREEAMAVVEPVPVVFLTDDIIVEAGGVVGQVEFDALEEAGFFRPAGVELFALGAVVAMLVGVLAVYLARFRPVVWNTMRRLALFGLLMVLAAIAARGVSVFIENTPEVGYLMPAAAIGLMAAILFDFRIAVLLAMAVGGVTAIATGDAGYTLFAVLSTVAPVPWVSSISARGDLRTAVVFMTVSLAAMAGAIAWFFQGESVVPTAMLYGAINGVLSGLVGTAALSFLEIAFDLTTNLRLLDLIDRNHPALRLLEEQATGTFNHSLMVGTLADRGARAVGANNLLALAAAYYHDLGKTENPQFFIENQFGSSNPHDRMPPEESAAVIRQHVVDGEKLARRFRIPADVIEGVASHHGDGVMRYFYNKAVERYGKKNVDIDDYRHAGHKPRSKEMAIVMMADAVEAASRATFEIEDPSPERITEVVEKVVGEKVADGQMSESDLTMGDLTMAKAAMVSALRSHYHQRIPYPNFPDVSTETPLLGLGGATAPPAPEIQTPSVAADPDPDAGHATPRVTE